MSLSGADTQIKTCYEIENMSPEEISEDQGFDVVAIKSKLMQISAKYRKDCGLEAPDESSLNFSDEQLEAVNREMFDLAIGAEDPNLRFKACSYIRDDKKGRKEVIKAVQHGGVTNNILMLNESIQMARLKAIEMKERLLGDTKKELIEA